MSKSKPEEKKLASHDDSEKAVHALWEKFTFANEVVKEDKKSPGFQMFIFVTITLILAGLGYTFWVRPALQNPVQTPIALKQNVKIASPPTPSATLLKVTPNAPAQTSTTTTPIIKSSPALRGNNTDLIPTATNNNIPIKLPTIPPSGKLITATAQLGRVGWVSSLDGQSHFNDPNIHVGMLSGHVYHGAIQFNLVEIPPNSIITYAALELTGLGDQNLSAGGLWQISLLDSDINEFWSVLTYDTIHNAAMDIKILPALTSAGLARNRVNNFPFGPEQLSILQQHLKDGVVSFRIDGPVVGDDNFFSWDSGYRGKKEVSSKPILQIIAISREYVVITSTPTPKNMLTALAMIPPTPKNTEATETPTPLPPHWVTPIIVTPKPRPENLTTATYEAEIAAAAAIIYGTVTPTPLNIWTTTPTPPGHVIITSTPSPENIITRAARAIIATRSAKTIGTYTPSPRNWVTPIVVTPHPKPGNAATAQFYSSVATANAILAGKTPVMIWTTTATPVYLRVTGEVATPWVTYTPSPTPPTIPSELVGKIAFLSNRSGGEDPLEKILVYAIDPDGSNLVVLTSRTFYDLAIARDKFSADQNFRSFVKDAYRFDGKFVPAIYFYDYIYNVDEQVTHFGAGLAWDPVWSPTENKIAFVSNDAGDDEIWVTDYKEVNPIQITDSNVEYNAREIGKDTFIPEVNKHPSWSPDGSKITFWSTRSGHPQVWIMNADGTEPYSISTTKHNDWDPVWIKYRDPPREVVP